MKHWVASNRIRGIDMVKKSEVTIAGQSFEGLKQTNEHGAEYWSARALQPLLGYSQWRRFEQAIERAGTKAGNKGVDAALSAIEMVNLLQQISKP